VVLPCPARQHQFDADDERALVVLAAQAGVAVENARPYEETRDRARRLEAVQAVATAILGGDPAEQVLALVARYARELAGADLATVAVPADGDELVVQAVDGEQAERLRGVRFPVEGSVAGEVLRTGKVVVLDDAADDDRTRQPLVRLGGIGPALFTPLSAEGRAFGALAVANGRGGPAFREADAQLLETFAAQAAVALEHVRLRREVERLAVLEDRERIAKELMAAATLPYRPASWKPIPQKRDSRRNRGAAPAGGGDALVAVVAGLISRSAAMARALQPRRGGPAGQPDPRRPGRRRPAPAPHGRSHPTGAQPPTRAPAARPAGPTPSPRPRQCR
jgi:GAF domain-containing protein